MVGVQQKTSYSRNTTQLTSFEMYHEKHKPYLDISLMRKARQLNMINGIVSSEYRESRWIKLW